MTKPLPMTNQEGEVRELTSEDFSRMQPAHKVIPSLFGKELTSQLLTRSQPETQRKISTTIRFDSEILTAFRATGKGWQTRMNNALRDWLQTHSPA